MQQLDPSRHFEVLQVRRLDENQHGVVAELREDMVIVGPGFFDGDLSKGVEERLGKETSPLKDAESSIRSSAMNRASRGSGGLLPTLTSITSATRDINTSGAAQNGNGMKKIAGNRPTFPSGLRGTCTRGQPRSIPPRRSLPPVKPVRSPRRARRPRKSPSTPTISPDEIVNDDHCLTPRTELGPEHTPRNNWCQFAFVGNNWCQFTLVRKSDLRPNNGTLAWRSH